MMTTQFALFVADDGQETTFTGSDVLHEMAEHARSFWPDPDLVARGDDEALDAFQWLARVEGLIPALEPAHAVAHARKLAPTLATDQIVIINLSGRGDKDVETASKLLPQTSGVEVQE